MKIKSFLAILRDSASLEEGMTLIHKDNFEGGLILPSPPSDEDKLSYLDTHRSYILGFGVASCLPLLAGVVLFAEVMYVFAPCAILLVTYLSISYFGVNVWGKDFDYEAHLRLVEANAEWPSVDVYLPCCGEDLDVLDNTYSYVSQLDYPGRLEVYVLDDSAKAGSVKALAQQYGFEYLRRDNVGELKKAGNLRSAFARTSGRVILILDADFCPRPEFLRETVPYINADPTVAIVQTPQFFTVKKEQTWVERAAGSQQCLFYKLIQQNRDVFAATICVGSCAIYRREALEPLGGTAPVERSEDVRTSFLVTDLGYRVRYVPLPLSTGSCPDNIKAYVSQTMRWAGGSLDLCFSRAFWRSNLTWQQKMCYFSGGMYYISTALSVITNPLPSILLLAFRPQLCFWYNSAYVVPSLLFSFVVMKRWNPQPYGLECLRIRYVQYTAYLIAFVDKLFDHQAEWVPTGARTTAKNARYNRCLQFLLMYTVAQAVIISSLVVWRVSQGFQLANFAPGWCIDMLNVLLALQVFYK